jgi:hypothetical protein
MVFLNLNGPGPFKKHFLKKNWADPFVQPNPRRLFGSAQVPDRPKRKKDLEGRCGSAFGFAVPQPNSFC